MPGRIDPALIEKITALAREGLTDRAIGLQVGRSRDSVAMIRHRYDITAGIAVAGNVLATAVLQAKRPAKPVKPGTLLTADEIDAALCRQADPEVWFDSEHGQQTAKRICARCPIVDRCREVALANGEQEGVWGGLTPEERGIRTAAQRSAAYRKRVAA